MGFSGWRLHDICGFVDFWVDQETIVKTGWSCKVLAYGGSRNEIKLHAHVLNFLMIELRPLC